MLLYGISEQHILRYWSLETLIKKVKNGFYFELLKAGTAVPEDEPVLQENDVFELEQLYRER